MRIFHGTFCRGNSIWCFSFSLLFSFLFVFGLFAGMVMVERERTAASFTAGFDSLFTECRKRTVEGERERERRDFEEKDD